MGGRYERDICHFKILEPAVSFLKNFNISLKHWIDLKTKGEMKTEANLCKGNRCPKRWDDQRQGSIPIILTTDH